jgi:uncharacterized tellurite resistance protein B-like protein
MKLTKEEFKALIMLYLANVDGEIHPNEVKVMLKKTDSNTYDRIVKLFSELNENQVLDCIHENKEVYANTEESRMELITDMFAVIDADYEITTKEEEILRALEEVLAK